MKHRKLPSQDLLKELLTYDPSTGVFVWRVKPCPRIHAGTVAGAPDHKGYMKVAIQGVAYLANRLAWMYVYGVDPGEMQVDHRDRNRGNNCIDNLRLATNSQNCQNKPAGAQQSNSASGLKGITYHSRLKKWRARVQVSGRRVSLGCYETKEAAAYAMRARREELHGEFANHG